MLCEQVLVEDKVPEQKQYNELKLKIRNKRKIIEVYDMVAHYELFLKHQ